MRLRTKRTDLSSENPTSRADPSLVLEPIWIRVHALGIDLEAGSSTTPHSPKSLGACLLIATISILGLTGGLGAVTRWLGGPAWLCLAAASVGLVVSASLTAAFLWRVYRKH